MRAEPSPSFSFLPSEFTMGKTPDLCKHTIIQGLFIAIVETPLAFIFSLTFIHSLWLLRHQGRKEPESGWKSCCPSSRLLPRPSCRHPHKHGWSTRSSWGGQRRKDKTAQQMGQSGHPCVHSLCSACRAPLHRQEEEKSSYNSSFLFHIFCSVL